MVTVRTRVVNVVRLGRCFTTVGIVVVVVAMGLLSVVVALMVATFFGWRDLILEKLFFGDGTSM